MKACDFIIAGCLLLGIVIFHKPKYVSITETLPHASALDFGKPRIYTLASDEDIDISWDGDSGIT